MYQNPIATAAAATSSNNNSAGQANKTDENVGGTPAPDSGLSNAQSYINASSSFVGAAAPTSVPSQIEIPLSRGRPLSSLVYKPAPTPTPSPAEKNPFLNYLKEFRQKFVHLNNVEMVRQGRAAWMTLSMEQKKKYYDMADKAANLQEANKQRAVLNKTTVKPAKETVKNPTTTATTIIKAAEAKTPKPAATKPKTNKTAFALPKKNAIKKLKKLKKIKKVKKHKKVGDGAKKITKEAANDADADGDADGEEVVSAANGEKKKKQRRKLRLRIKRKKLVVHADKAAAKIVEKVLSKPTVAAAKLKGKDAKADKKLSTKSEPAKNVAEKKSLLKKSLPVNANEKKATPVKRVTIVTPAENIALEAANKKALDEKKNITKNKTEKVWGKSNPIKAAAKKVKVSKPEAATTSKNAFSKMASKVKADSNKLLTDVKSARKNAIKALHDDGPKKPIWRY